MPGKAYISPRRFYRVLHNIADRNIGPMERAFLDAIRVTADDIDEATLAAALESRDVIRAFDAVGLNGQLEMRIKNHMALALATVFAQSARVAAVPLGAALKANVTGMFNKTNVEAVRYAQSTAARLVIRVSKEAKEEIRSLIVRGFVEERTLRTTEKEIAAVLARRVKSTMGLTKQQHATVKEFRAGLRQRAALQAMARTQGVEATAREFCVTTQKVWAAVNKPGLTLEQSEARAERFAVKALKRRANTIARTETIQASTAGQRTLWRAAENDDLLRFDPDLPTQYTTPDGELIDGPTLHPNCRCAEGTLVVEGVARRVWIVTPDDRLCPECAQMPILNPDGVGLADEETGRMVA